MADRLAATPSGGELKLRVLSAAILVPVALAAEIIGGAAFAILVGLVAVLGFLEWSAITAGGEPDWLRHGALAALVLVLIAAATATPSLTLELTALAAAFAIALGQARPGARWIAGGIAYLALPAIAMIALRAAEPRGWAAILFLFAVVWTTDTAAYFAGRAVGGPKLWPRVSPKKTWSGAIGGLAGAVIVGAIIAGSTASGEAGRAAALGGVLAAILSMAAQAGDFFESAVKRRFGAKDSGRIIPGHGGVLDRMDGVFAAAVAAALIALAGLGGALLAWPSPPEAAATSSDLSQGGSS